jgi:hypothetical protein
MNVVHNRGRAAHNQPDSKPVLRWQNNHDPVNATM